MLYYDRIDVSEGIDVNKTSAAKEYAICRYWCFLNYSFKFQPNVCNRCHYLLMMSINFSDIAFLNIKGSDPPGKYMFVEYSWNIPIRYSQYIPKKFPMKFRGIFRNNAPGMLNIGMFPDCSMNILQILHRIF